MGTYIVLIIMTVIIAAFVKKQENGAGVCILTRQQACNYVWEMITAGMKSSFI